MGDFSSQVPYLVISITDPNLPEATLLPDENRVGVLRLKFHDWEREESGMTLIVPEQAQQIVNFVNTHLPQVKLIVCHCEAGLSRSVGVAAAISYWLNGEDQWFFKQATPNRKVYRAVLDAAMMEERPDLPPQRVLQDLPSGLIIVTTSTE